MKINSEAEIVETLQDYFEELNHAQKQFESEKLACGEGCSFCCHLHITVKPYELFPLVNFISSQTSEKQSEMRAIIDLNCEKMENVNDEELLLLNFDCPFLIEGSCSIYEDRPTSCRTAHSKRKEVCETAFNSPNLALEAEHIDGFAESIRDRDEILENELGEYHDVSDYNMNLALQEALSDESSKQRFIDGDEVFEDSVLSRV